MTGRALSFGSVAARYDRFRPRTPAALLDWVVPPGAEDALDLAAGTGAQTALLVPRIAHVTAVEPDPAMRAVLAERVPAATALHGTAEAIPLADASLDLVTVSSAWHWFDHGPAAAEIARVLRPGGRLAVLGNGMLWEMPWLTEIRARERPHEGPAALRGHDPMHDARLPAGAPFGPVEDCVLDWSQPMTPDEIVGLFGTYSAVITATPERRAGSETRIREVLATHLETRDRDVVDVPMRSWAWRAAAQQRP